MECGSSDTQSTLITVPPSIYELGADGATVTEGIGRLTAVCDAGIAVKLAILLHCRCGSSGAGARVSV
jgi:hypothetical protein